MTVRWLGEVYISTVLLQGGSRSCLPLAPHPHGAEAWLLGAEKELRQAGRQAEEPGLLVCLFVSGNLCTEYLPRHRKQVLLSRAIPRVQLEAAREKGLEEVSEDKDVLCADDPNTRAYDPCVAPRLLL